MQVIFSVNKAMARWLSDPQPLPLMPSTSEDADKAGVVPLFTDEAQISWQCSVVEHPAADERYTVIMVEAFSRCTVLLPYQSRPSLHTIETDFIARWLEDMTRFSVASGRLKREQVNDLFHQFMAQSRDYRWYQNTDLNVQSHLVDAECSLMTMLVDAGETYLTSGRAEAMAEYLNAGDRTAPQGQAASLESFMPVERFLQDALYRYAQGMAQAPFAVNEEGDFANPHASTSSSANIETALGSIKNNVVGAGRFGNNE